MPNPRLTDGLGAEVGLSEPKEQISSPIPPKQPGDDKSPQKFLTQPNGRPTPERLGVDPNMGGRPREEDRNFMSSDVLIERTLRQLPPGFRTFSSTKIERPSVQLGYDRPTNVGGAYFPEWQDRNDRVTVGRGNETYSEDFAVSVARHELLHKMQFRHPAYAADQQAGFPGLLSVMSSSLGRLVMNPRNHQQVQEALRFYRSGDLVHVWTAMAEMAVNNPPSQVDPAMRSYFAPLWNQHWQAESIQEGNPQKRGSKNTAPKGGERTKP